MENVYPVMQKPNFVMHQSFFYNVWLLQSVFQEEKLPVLCLHPSSAGKREKDLNSVASFAMPNAIVTTVGHDFHRFRRGLLSSFLSKRSVLELSPILHEKNSKLMQRFEKAYEEIAVLELTDAFAAFSADLISQYSWGVGLGFLDHENFNNEFRHDLTDMITFVHIFRIFPRLLVIQNAIHRWHLRSLRPRMSSILDMQALVAQKSTPTSQKLNPPVVLLQRLFLKPWVTLVCYLKKGHLVDLKMRACRWFLEVLELHQEHWHSRPSICIRNSAKSSGK